MKNSGGDTSETITLSHYLSTTENIDTTNNTNLQTGTATIVGLAYNTTSNASLTITAPRVAGTYYYQVCAEVDNELIIGILVKQQNGTTSSRAWRCLLFNRQPNQTTLKNVTFLREFYRKGTSFA